MKLRFLYTLGLLLCLSNFASPNECSRHCPLAASSTGPAASTAQATSTVQAASPVTPSTAPAASASASEPAAAADTQTASGQGESNSPTLIKLLYI